MKKILPILTALVLVFSLAACRFGDMDNSLKNDAEDGVVDRNGSEDGVIGDEPVTTLPGGADGTQSPAYGENNIPVTEPGLGDDLITDDTTNGTAPSDTDPNAVTPGDPEDNNGMNGTDGTGAANGTNGTNGGTGTGTNGNTGSFRGRTGSSGKGSTGRSRLIPNSCLPALY